MANVWKIGAGETGRDYSELYFDHDVMIIGPSHLGSAIETPYEGRFPAIEAQINNFAKRPRPGDRVIARLGKTVIGIGQIPDPPHHEYMLDPSFRCVYGWELQHCRRVIWARNIDLRPFRNAFQNIRGSMPSFTGVMTPSWLVERVRSLPDHHFRRQLRPLPSIEPRRYDERTLGVELFAAGMSSRNIQDIWEALLQASRMWKWYEANQAEGRPTEHEIVSHMILPLFLGLGWSHQQIAVEWHRVDMAFFKKMPTTPDNCCMILEAKGREKPLGEVVGQARRYIDRLRLSNVKHLVTTDGGNLFVYTKRGSEWPDEPSHYMSVWSPQNEYVVPKGARTVDTLVQLQPSAL